jgi:required for meiotic nuclear division protein 1
MLKVEAFQIAEQINIKKFKANFKQAPIQSSSTDLYYSETSNKFISVFGYGVVAMAGYSATEKSEFVNFLKQYCEDIVTSDFKEDFTVIENKDQPFKLNYNSIEIPTVNHQVVQIVMLNIAQSVSLDFYENLAENILTETSSLTKELESKGSLSISKKNLLKFIGKALNVKNSIIDNLYIFDAPDIVWESEYLGKIDDALKKALDLKMRYREIDYKLKIVQENLTLFTDLLQNNQSHRMELIVIILILIEVIHLIVGYFKTLKF